jgi:hypothetical protein
LKSEKPVVPRLELYYATEGAAEPVVITLPKGGYVPLFELRATHKNRAAAAGLRSRLSLVAVAVLGFLAICGSRDLPAVGVSKAGPRRDAVREFHAGDYRSGVVCDRTRRREDCVRRQRGGSPRLWLRALKSTSAKPVAGTEHASLPFWSPDSRSVGFFANGPVERIDLETGLVQTLARASVPSR